MANLWGGRFNAKTDSSVFDFNESLSFDKRLYEMDIRGSLVHGEMLARQGIISREDGDAIKNGLTSILEDIHSGKLVVEGGYEDIHSFVEGELTKRVGEPGKRLHTGRSRNDQVALDMKLYVRDNAGKLRECIISLLQVLLGLMKENRNTYMPGFTHLQKAQPVTLALHLGAYFEMFKRDVSRIDSFMEHSAYCPLGAGALAGTTYPLDRDYTARELGFDAPTLNSMDSVSDRDYLIEYLSDLSIIMMHLSRFSEEFIIWNSQDYAYVEMDDAYSTGSSIMPQKKNPDVAELIRGKTGRVYGALMQILTTMKGLPLAYNKDMQEDKELSFDAMDTASVCVRLFTGMLSTVKFNKDNMRRAATGGFTNATDLADYLVNRGVPFRDAHRISGEAVLKAIDKGCNLEQLSPEDLRSLDEHFGDDIYEAISLETCVDKRLTAGAPGKSAMEEQIGSQEAYLERLTKK